MFKKILIPILACGLLFSSCSSDDSSDGSQDEPMADLFYESTSKPGENSLFNGTNVSVNDRGSSASSSIRAEVIVPGLSSPWNETFSTFETTVFFPIEDGYSIDSQIVDNYYGTGGGNFTLDVESITVGQTQTFADGVQRVGVTFKLRYTGSQDIERAAFLFVMTVDFENTYSLNGEFVATTMVEYELYTN